MFFVKILSHFIQLCMSYLYRVSQNYCNHSHSLRIKSTVFTLFLTKIKNYASRSIPRHCRRCNKTASLLMECSKIAYTTVFRRLGVLKNHPRFSKLLSQAHTLHIHRPPPHNPKRTNSHGRDQDRSAAPSIRLPGSKGEVSSSDRHVLRHRPRDRQQSHQALRGDGQPQESDGAGTGANVD